MLSAETTTRGQLPAPTIKQVRPALFAPVCHAGLMAAVAEGPRATEQFAVVALNVEASQQLLPCGAGRQRHRCVAYICKTDWYFRLKIAVDTDLASAQRTGTVVQHRQRWLRLTGLGFR